MQRTDPAVGNEHVVAETKYSKEKVKSRTALKNKKENSQEQNDRKIRKSEEA